MDIESENALVAACKDLVEYRKRISPLNFQLEKLDDYIRAVEIALEGVTYYDEPCVSE